MGGDMQGVNRFAFLQLNVSKKELFNGVKLQLPVSHAARQTEHSWSEAGP